MVTLNVDAGSAAELAHLVGKRFESFTMLEGVGAFRGVTEKLWLIKIATSDLTTLLAVAEEICMTFQQDGVGVECHSRYYRATGKTTPKK